MAERDGRLRVDRRAVALGARRGLVGTVLAFAGLALVRLAFQPVLRDLAGDLSLPGYRELLGYSAAVGALIGWVRMRGARRLVGAIGTADCDCDADAEPGGDADCHCDSGTDLEPGARALAVARANRRAEQRSEHSGRGSGVGRPARVVSVQRWSPDLLDGDRRPSEQEGLTS